MNSLQRLGYHIKTLVLCLCLFQQTTTSSSDSGLNVFSESMSATQQNDASSIGTLQIFLTLRGVSSQNCADMFNDQVVMNEIRKQKFHLLLLEMFVPCDALLAEYLKGEFKFMVEKRIRINIMLYLNIVFHVYGQNICAKVLTYLSQIYCCNFSTIHRYDVNFPIPCFRRGLL